ncbi:MAG: hypothetical protein V8T35_07785 [Prevotella sp.]
MTRRNDKRNNRRNRQRNNNPELPAFAQMLFGALLGKGVDMIAKKMAENAEEEAPDIHAEGISNQDVTNINNGKASLTKCTIPTDGTAVELPIPDNLQVFISEDGKPMIRKKIEGDEDKEAPDAAEGKPITYDDICKELFLNKITYWLGNKKINYLYSDEYTCNDLNNCTSMAQAKRVVAFIKLQNIAKYLNGDWKANFKDGSKKWYIFKDTLYGVSFNYTASQGIVYFKNADLANEAIRLMGEESLNDLFSTDW